MRRGGRHRPHGAPDLRVPAAEHPRPGGRRPRLRGRIGSLPRHLQRRDLQRPRAATRSHGARPPLRDPLRHRGHSAPVRGARPVVRRSPERHVRLRYLRRAREPAGPRARPRRREAALLPRARRRGDVRLRDQSTSGPPARAPRAGPARPHPLPPVRLLPCAAHAVRRRAQAAGRPPAHRRAGAAEGRAVLGPEAFLPGDRPALRSFGGRSGPRGAAPPGGGGPPETAGRRAGRGVLQRRRRFIVDRSAGGGHHGPRRSDLHARLR